PPRTVFRRALGDARSAPPERQRKDGLPRARERRPRVTGGTRAAHHNHSPRASRGPRRLQPSEGDGEPGTGSVPLVAGVASGMEPPGEHGAALDAAVAVEAIEADGMPVALDERRPAARAEGRLPLGVVHVADG